MSDTNPLDDSWKWVESARKDREAAVSQWRAERIKRGEIEAQRDALAKALRDVWAQPAFSILPADVRGTVEAALRAVEPVGTRPEGLSGE